MKGFTLVEMLVALFIFSLLAAAGVTVMRFTVDNQVAVRGRMDRLGDIQRTRALLKSDLEQAAPRRTRDEAGTPAAGPFGGGPPPGALLAFSRRGWDNPDRAARGSLQYVEYRVEEGRLERRSRPALDGARLGEPQRLIDGVQAADVEFLSQGAWRPTWTSSSSVPMPQVVRLTLTLKSVGEVRQLFLLPGGAS
ncbi:MAG: type II secretion system minor pseudopilin GspJ [Phenylobacterium sp.]|uniref:type II secretion system minor pseudopilin GspJ n=1 Tax=Phenylobacterium sp. TaxID=1871053 RepID=UPI00271DE6C6|nr:type II secretion system minor pseudopilin GspJ [Phenylobacterium sp.]MDO9248556.1 type II secretion system minor pseudopilin GspJ [Phenylobacterium sp.]MDP3633474.1 type II secretion system minor pseudopilin GspJ [Phenylobacterium sp.]